MRFLLYGSNPDDMQMTGFIKNVFSDAEIFVCDNEDDFRESTLHFSPDAAIVALDGANGMEAVIAAKRQCPDISVVWFSDDKDFALQAYRLNVSYFHRKPITQEVINKAVRRCRLSASLAMQRE